MKTTKKRLLLGVAGFALCTGAVFTTLAATAEPQITDETMLANIEALSDPEGGGIIVCTGGKIWCAAAINDNTGQVETFYKP